MKKKIFIDQAPIFHNYLYQFIKENIDLNCTLEFLSENVFISGYCPCNQKSCATIHLESKIPLPQYKNMQNISKNEMLQRLHFDENDILKEFEYIDRNTTEEVAFKKEIMNIFNDTIIYRD